MTETTKTDRMKADRLLRRIPRIRGECRRAYKCRECGHVYGRQFIPYAIGRGTTYDPCMCICTDINVSHKAKEIMTRTP